MKQTDMQAVNKALSRLRGCDLKHLSFAEAHVIQALRNLGFTDHDYVRLFIILTQDGDTCRELKRILNNVKV